ncbi:MAG TPA: peptidylprolyl isomerase [Candidatus Limnocylindrales bacterium]|nr:peptidylprolyl isomerase [Candidatus Limnocylindrales bacterium]
MSRWPRPALPVRALACALLVAGCLGGAVPSAPPRPAVTPLARPPSAPAGSGLTATIRTRLGDIVLELYDGSAPVATANFVSLARAGWYDGVAFHRLVPGFVIQGGDGVHARAAAFDAQRAGRGGPGYTIPDEPVVGEYGRGIVAMARTPAPDSAGSQFFIVLDDAARGPLESSRTYVIFGRVSSGMEVVDAIAAMPNSGQPANQALDPVAMDAVTISGP